MNLLGEIFRGFGLRCHQYIDDTQLLYIHPKRAEDTLNWCLEVGGKGYMRMNKLKIKPNKMQVLLVGLVLEPVDGISPVLDEIVLLTLNFQVCSLGVF